LHRRAGHSQRRADEARENHAGEPQGPDDGDGRRVAAAEEGIQDSAGRVRQHANGDAGHRRD
jgi:hypothetical protein